MGHCGGGSGPSSIDMLGAIDQWGANRQGARAARCQQPARPASTYAASVCISEARDVQWAGQYGRGKELPLQHEFTSSTVVLRFLYFESLATSCKRQSRIEAHQLERRRIMIGGDQGGGKLQAISGPQRMCPQ
jgi:hypothetical protein